MKEMLITAYDMACIADYLDLGAKKTAEVLEKVWENDKVFLREDYRKNKKKWIFDYHYWADYLYHKGTLDTEFSAIQRDLYAINSNMQVEDYVREFMNIDFFFILMRIEILYLRKQNYRKLKLRTLFAQYGYKRRSEKIVRYIHDCLNFYHIQTFLRDNVECDIENIGIDEMIIFRVI